MKTDKLYLVGFMGTGKTTLARALGQRLGWRVEDIDERIERREQQTIADIFRTRGEPYFRAVEREVLYDLLPLRHTVVATGGGTFADPDSRRLMLNDGTVVWLDLPFDRLVDRIPTDGRRPLATDREALARLYATRRAAYRHAHLRLDVGVRVEELVDRLLDRLGW